MKHFPGSAHMASWAGLCSGNCESAGKRLSWTHAQGQSVSAPFYRTAARKGMKKAAVAVDHNDFVIRCGLFRTIDAIGMEALYL